MVLTFVFALTMGLVTLSLVSVQQYRPRRAPLVIPARQRR